MALVQRDFILRMIEAIAAAIASIRKRKLLGDLAGARQEVRSATLHLLGPSAAMATMVDSRTAANLVSDPRRIVLWCQLLSEESDLLRQGGHSVQAAATDGRIVELMLEAWSREKEWETDTVQLFRDARARGGDAAVDAGHQAALGAWDMVQPQR